MPANTLKNKRRTRRKIGIRKRVFGSAERPRFTVFRSSKHMYAQLVDDFSGNTLASASTVAAKLDKGCDTDASAKVGQAIAEAGKAKGITQVTFDRNGYRYHGRVKALADAAREAGLSF